MGCYLLIFRCEIYYMLQKNIIVNSTLLVHCVVWPICHCLIPHQSRLSLTVWLVSYLACILCVPFLHTFSTIWMSPSWTLNLTVWYTKTRSNWFCLSMELWIKPWRSDTRELCMVILCVYCTILGNYLDHWKCIATLRSDGSDEQSQSGGVGASGGASGLASSAGGKGSDGSSKDQRGMSSYTTGRGSFAPIWHWKDFYPNTFVCF